MTARLGYRPIYGESSSNWQISVRREGSTPSPTTKSGEVPHQPLECSTRSWHSEPTRTPVGRTTNGAGKAERGFDSHLHSLARMAAPIPKVLGRSAFTAKAVIEAPAHAASLLVGRLDTFDRASAHNSPSTQSVGVPPGIFQKSPNFSVNLSESSASNLTTARSRSSILSTKETVPQTKLV